MPATHAIIVVGSSNTDMVIKAKTFPIPGETILGGEFFMFPGGKGANQAVAAARLGGRITLIAKLGDDIFGKQALKQFKEEGIQTQFIVSDNEHPTGVALITVDAKGENTIVVAQGSNAHLSPSDVRRAQDEIKASSIVLIQLEIPLETVMAATILAHEHGKKVILNPAPAMPLPDELFRYLHILTPNRSEAEAITGVSVVDTHTASIAAEIIRKKGVPYVVITLGSEGAFIFDESGGRLIPGKKVTAIDSTAAGDIFNGALAVALSEGKLLDDAVGFANSAAALSVTRMGAQASAPFRTELNDFT
ncbi:MAG TPA: ribokinase [Chryseolinea sp.]|nr:ribokinase [Chryseolinea sp.]